MVATQPQHEAQARLALSARLAPGEALLACTLGAVLASFARNYYLGLTGERLILVELDRDLSAVRTLSLRRELIRSVRWMGGLFASAIQLQLPQESLRVSVRNNWKDSARALADLAGQPAPAPAPLSSVHLVRQIEDLQRLGLLAPAESWLQDVLQRHPALGADPALLTLQARLADSRLALRAGAVFLFVNMGVMVLFSALAALARLQDASALLPPAIFAALIDLAIIASLWRGQTLSKGFAILRALLGLLVYSALNAGLGDALGFIPNLALAVALVIVLTGEGGRRRTYAAMAIFGVGYLGSIALLVAVSFLATAR